MKLAKISVISALTLSLAATPALAQSAKEKAAEVETTAKLNREQAELARQQKAENVASQEAHDAGVQRQADFEAEKARLNQQHEQAMTNWQADVDACNAGDRSRCAPPPAQ